jgi:hypothetical protein
MTDSQTRDITRIPRAVLAAAVGVVHTVERAVGAAPLRTARGNAWEAVCADRARAAERAELRRRIETLRPATPVGRRRQAVGSSPRSRASQAPVGVAGRSPDRPAGRS